MYNSLLVIYYLHHTSRGAAMAGLCRLSLNASSPLRGLRAYFEWFSVYSRYGGISAVSCARMFFFFVPLFRREFEGVADPATSKLDAAGQRCLLSSFL